jgi:hypothetical protein
MKRIRAKKLVTMSLEAEIVRTWGGQEHVFFIEFKSLLKIGNARGADLCLLLKRIVAV